MQEEEEKEERVVKGQSLIFNHRATLFFPNPALDTLKEVSSKLERTNSNACTDFLGGVGHESAGQTLDLEVRM